MRIVEADRFRCTKGTAPQTSWLKSSEQRRVKIPSQQRLQCTGRSFAIGLPHGSFRKRQEPCLVMLLAKLEMQRMIAESCAALERTLASEAIVGPPCAAALRGIGER